MMGVRLLLSLTCLLERNIKFGVHFIHLLKGLRLAKKTSHVVKYEKYPNLQNLET